MSIDPYFFFAYSCLRLITYIENDSSIHKENLITKTKKYSKCVSSDSHSFHSVQLGTGIITAAQHHLMRPELRLCASSNPA